MASFHVRLMAALLFALSSQAAGVAESNVAAMDQVELEHRITRILDEHKVPGMSAVIADRDGIVWTVGIGQADVATRRAVSPDTLFRVGSISKTFVGLAALKLVEEGRLSLQIPGAQSGAGGFFSPSTPGT